MAFYGTFAHRDMFSSVAAQTMYWDQKDAGLKGGMVTPAAEANPLLIYYDWGKYDLRSPMEGFGAVEWSRSFAKLLAERCSEFSGGEMHDGGGWASWKNRTGRIFELLFPLEEGTK